MPMDHDDGVAADGEAVDGETPTVLIVDDEDAVLDSYELYLESESYDVRTAANGGEALVALGPEVDVVLLDRRMPGMTGDEVLDHIREWQSNCRVVMITAVDPGVDIVDMAFDDYLTKPIERDELIGTIEQLLLFDRYERLIQEYHSLTRKYATLKATLAESELSSDDDVASLKARREQLREDIDEAIQGFADDEISDILRDAHHTG
jgi:DNA-binding response OmpR family regulator